ncbi:MAG: hypothetical protein ACLQK8_00080 [Streptosporangiaceae bacterium]
MTVSPPTTAQPVSTGYFLMGRELTTATVAPVFQSFKAKPLKPNPKPSWVRDESMWGDMNSLHDLQQGPRWTELEISESPLYGDTFGQLAFGFFGDYTTTGTGTTPTWTTTVAPVAGGTVLTVGAGSTAVSGTFIQVDTSTNSEVVTVTTGSTGTTISINPNTPLRFNHGTTTTITTVTAPFAHTFATLNPNSSTGLTSCQPPSHSIVHHNYLPGSGGYYADQFLYAVVTDLSIMGDAKGWLTYSAKMTSYIQSAPGSTISATISTIKGVPAWKSNNTIQGSAYNGISKWQADFTRKVDIIPTADGVQDPYFLGLGAMDAKFKLTYDPAIDETALNYMLQNTQPTLAWAISNGGAGSSLISLNINAELAGYEESPLMATNQFWGYDVSGELVASSTYAGNSGGNTLCQLVLENAIPSY